MSCGTHHGARYWMSTDVCGWVCATLVYVFMSFAVYTTVFSILPVWPTANSLSHSFHLGGYLLCMLLAFWSHVKTMLTDPGSVPKDAIPLGYYDTENGGKFQPHDNYCKHCKAYKPRTSHHCSACNRCIVRMDHHCPWANNCIGQNNHKFFILFVSYTFVACLWTLYLLTYRALLCGQSYELDNSHGWKSYVQTNPQCESKFTSTFTLILLGLEAIFFGLFTMCMMCDASSMFMSGSTQVDQYKLKKTGTQPQSLYSCTESFAIVFGGDGHFSPSWLIPIDARWKHASKQFGFMLPLKPSSSEQLI